MVLCAAFVAAVLLNSSAPAPQAVGQLESAQSSQASAYTQGEAKLNGGDYDGAYEIWAERFFSLDLTPQSAGERVSLGHAMRVAQARAFRDDGRSWRSLRIWALVSEVSALASAVEDEYSKQTVARAQEILAETERVLKSEGGPLGQAYVAAIEEHGRKDAWRSWKTLYDELVVEPDTAEMAAQLGYNIGLLQWWAYEDSGDPALLFAAWSSWQQMVERWGASRTLGIRTAVGAAAARARSLERLVADLEPTTFDEEHPPGIYESEAERLEHVFVATRDSDAQVNARIGVHSARLWSFAYRAQPSLSRLERAQSRAREVVERWEESRSPIFVAAVSQAQAILDELETQQKALAEPAPATVGPAAPTVAVTAPVGKDLPQTRSWLITAGVATGVTVVGAAMVGTGAGLVARAEADARAHDDPEDSSRTREINEMGELGDAFMIAGGVTAGVGAVASGIAWGVFGSRLKRREAVSLSVDPRQRMFFLRLKF